MLFLFCIIGTNFYFYHIFLLPITDDYTRELQCDVRGTTTMRDHKVCVTVGEIKSAKGKHEAVKQLVKRLVVIGSATKKIANIVPVSLHGDVYTRRSEWLSDGDDIVKVVTDILARLKLSPLAAELNISVDICKI